MDSMKKTARIAGLLYLLLAVTSTVGLSIPGFIVRGDATATANKIAAHQLLYRLCIVSDLASQFLFVFMVLTLHQLFNGVSKRLAALMVALVFVQVPMMFATMLCVIAPLVLWDGADYWSAFNKHQLDALAMGSLGLRAYGINAVTALWGLWLLPFGLLVFRSGFIPRILGIFLVVACFADLTISATSMLFPAYEPMVHKLMIFGIGEFFIILWLLIKGVTTQASADAAFGQAGA